MKRLEPPSVDTDHRSRRRLVDRRGLPAAVRRGAGPLLAALLLAIQLPLTSRAAGRIKGPYLIPGGEPTAVTVLWQLDRTQRCTIEWGRTDRYELGTVRTTEYGHWHQHAFTIRHLRPAARYHYRVRMGDRWYASSFFTPPPPGSTTLEFLAYGDTRSHPADHDRVTSAMLRDVERDHVPLVVVVGDLVAHGRNEADWAGQFFDAAYPHIQRLLASAPYLSCIGNHELKGGGPDLFARYFPYPWKAAHYGSFDAGPAHFVVVDQYVDYEPGSPQYRWIVSDLARTTSPWRFVVLHQPGYSAGGHSDSARVQRVLQPLFERYGVAMVFAGHNHYYARAVVNGVEHITTGGGGAPLYDPDPHAPMVVRVARSLHYCRVRIDGDDLRFAAIAPDGTVLDTFSLSRPAVPATTEPPGLQQTDHQ